MSDQTKWSYFLCHPVLQQLVLIRLDSANEAVRACDHLAMLQSVNATRQ